MRQNAVQCLNAWVEHTGLAIFVEAELFVEALKLENPYLRAEVSIKAMVYNFLAVILCVWCTICMYCNFSHNDAFHLLHNDRSTAVEVDVLSGNVSGA
jgi:hypothetical protein